jgi:hypothetical protein
MAMETNIKKELTEFYEIALGDYLESLSSEELKCIDWLVNDADPFIEEKNRKVA